MLILYEQAFASVKSHPPVISHTCTSIQIESVLLIIFATLQEPSQLTFSTINSNVFNVATVVVPNSSMAAVIKSQL